MIYSNIAKQHNNPELFKNKVNNVENMNKVTTLFKEKEL